MTNGRRILITNSGRKWIGEVGHCVMLARTLESLGHTVWIACRKGSALEEHAVSEGIKHLALVYSSGLSPARDLADARALAALVRKERIEVIHVHRGKDHWLAVPVARRAGIPIVRTRHVVTPVKQHAANRWLYRRRTAALISVSKAAEKSLGKLVESIPIRRVILSAVDVRRFNPGHRSEAWRRDSLSGLQDAAAPLWIGLIGRWQGIKGQEYFIEAAGRIARDVPEARFLIAGTGLKHKRGKYEGLVREQGIENKVLFAGRLPNIAEVMASLDLGVIASIGSEGSSRVGLELMASGAPVLATCVGGIPDLLLADPAQGCNHPAGPGPGDLGWLVPPRDAGAMAEAATALLLDAARRSEMAARALDRVRERHDPVNWAAEVARIYDQVLESRP